MNRAQRKARTTALPASLVVLRTGAVRALFDSPALLNNQRDKLLARTDACFLINMSIGVFTVLYEMNASAAIVLAVFQQDG